MIYYNQTTKHINLFQKVYSNPNIKIIPKIPPKFPFFIDIELTNNCNLKCIMCPRGKAERKNGYMNSSLFKKVVDECQKYKTPIRFIGWGEPLLHNEFSDYVKYVKQKNLLLHITTNGTLLNNIKINNIVKNNVDSIIISLQGTNDKQYAYIRRTNKYNEIKENVKKLVEVRNNKKLPFIQISTTTTIETGKEIQSFVNEWLPLVDAVSVGTTNFNITGSVSLIAQKLALKHKPWHVPCTEVYHQIQVDWDGNVSPCCGDYDNFLTIGNVNKDTIYYLWNNSKKLNCIRELLKNKGHKTLTLCNNCYPAYRECD